MQQCDDSSQALVQSVVPSYIHGGVEAVVTRRQQEPRGAVQRDTEPPDVTLRSVAPNC